MSHLTVIKPTTVYVPPTFSYSHAVRMGDFVFVSGQVAQNAKGELVGKDDIRAQTEQVFENLRLILEAGGIGFGPRRQGDRSHDAARVPAGYP